MSSGGKRRAAPAPRRPRPGGRTGGRTLALAVGITLCVVAWGYLVYAAVDFGTTARAGQSSAWIFLALACVGAIACLFVGLMLIARLGTTLGLGRSGDAPVDDEQHSPAETSAPRDAADHPPAGAPQVPAQPAPQVPVQPRAPRVKGGKRAAR